MRTSQKIWIVARLLMAVVQLAAVIFLLVILWQWNRSMDQQEEKLRQAEIRMSK